MTLVVSYPGPANKSKYRYFIKDLKLKSFNSQLLQMNESFETFDACQFTDKINGEIQLMQRLTTWNIEK